MASLTIFNLSYSSSIPNFRTIPKPTQQNRKTAPKFTCNARKDDQKSKDQETSSSTKKENSSSTNLDRRNVLLGIGGAGLYGASTFGAINPSAFAAPLSPTFTACHNSTDPDSKEVPCCPPSTGNSPTDFVPTAPSVITTRPAAQLVDSTYLKKYKKAIEAMKNLSSDDPRNFTAQANVHCAYCNGGYYQEGYADSKLLLDVHNSWLFFPFHRWYLYFFEKICQNLIDDDTFALPYWNWDNPPGMYLPAIFKDSTSSLYDSLRNQDHLTTVIDLSWSGSDSSTDSNTTVIRNNLNVMYKQMVTQSTTPLKFFGKAFRAGEESDPGAGSIETSPHTNVHRWTGDPNESHGEDMGAFYTAGRDPVFYCHHANVDRMWYIWNSLGGQNLVDSDWLNSSFYFYNEQAKPVKVYVKDCLDISVLGYNYQTVDIPWLNSKPSPRRTAITLPSAPVPSQVFPTTLEKTISVLVKRPKKTRSRKEKKKAEEVLEITGIKYDVGEFVKFDVYINEDNPEESGPEKTELVGSFINLPHGHSMTSTTSKGFALTEVLQELGADDFESILVTLVPKSSSVTIGGVKIKYENTKVSSA